MKDEEGWHKIADSSASIDFNEKNLATAKVNGHIICLIKTASGILACTNKCPHAGGTLSEGFVDRQKNIVCPVHHYRFNLLTGRDAFNEGYFLKRFKVKVNEDGVFVEVQEYQVK